MLIEFSIYEYCVTELYNVTSMSSWSESEVPVVEPNKEVPAGKSLLSIATSMVTGFLASRKNPNQEVNVVNSTAKNEPVPET